MSASAAPRLRSVTLIVLDSAGIGGAPDAADFGDEGSATVPHVAAAVGGLHLPNLGRLGLGRLAEIEGVEPHPSPAGGFGVLTEESPGKDTTTGHWELAGIRLDKAFPTYPHGFPPEVIRSFEEATGTEVIGNEVASGTEIITRLGDEHVRSGQPIVYTSADSVFQIAAHTDVVPLPRLYELCKIARRVMRGRHEVGRVIARPFAGTGTPDDPFVRTPDRHDYSVMPPSPMVLEEIASAGHEVRGIGKISDIFAGKGLTSSHPTRSNDDGMSALLEHTTSVSSGLVFANLVDFDQSFGHRNDPKGYAGALEAFDRWLPELIAILQPDQAAIITADHGNDPTTPSTDHSRERVPVLVAGERIAPFDLGVRASFADCGATITDLLGVPTGTPGSSFAGGMLLPI
ncbi:MAG: phosphopentomutase [Actinomycetota bacterium]